MRFRKYISLIVIMTLLIPAAGCKKMVNKPSNTTLTEETQPYAPEDKTDSYTASLEDKLSGETDETILEDKTTTEQEAYSENISASTATEVIQQESTAQVTTPTQSATQPSTQKATQAATQPATQKATEAQTTAPTVEQTTEAATREKTIWDYPWDLDAIEAELRAYGESLGMLYIDEALLESDWDNSEYLQSQMSKEEYVQRFKLTPDNANWMQPHYLDYDDSIYISDAVRDNCYARLESLAARGRTEFKIYFELDSSGKHCTIYTLY